MREPIVFHAVKTNYALEVEIYGRVRTGEERKLAVVQPVNLEIRVIDPMVDGPAVPMMRVETEVAQALFDALADAGFRHSTETQSAAQLAATELHLTDMRCLVEKAYQVNLMVGVTPPPR
jgi:hypothetical protein